jgi:hypothetical protein
VDVDSFVRDGFVAVRRAVDTDTAAAGRELIWQSMARRGVRGQGRSRADEAFRLLITGCPAWSARR